MTESRIEALIGVAVLIAAATFLSMMLRVSPEHSGDGTYALVAEFTSAQGISVGTEVRMAGIIIGSVRGMSINTQTYKADVTMEITDGIEIFEDSVVKVSSNGLLGDAYISIQQGIIPIALESGDRIVDTQGRIDLIDALVEFVN
ncbi:MAG: MlaD family protein [Rhodobacteraceae bacterium]|nr:MlaD family protein [Paracoccaceae bacterium]